MLVIGPFLHKCPLQVTAVLRGVCPQQDGWPPCLQLPHCLAYGMFLSIKYFIVNWFMLVYQTGCKKGGLIVMTSHVKQHFCPFPSVP